MKKIITLLNEDKVWTGIFKGITAYLLFTVIATLSNLNADGNWLEHFSKSLLWPVQLIKYLLAN